ncbi:MAG: 5-deoxy-glucuronate isomerase [Chloroflexota bacterium]|nr:5-deoxy-glucuronate isomerase [Chloroflexota bacterium]
MSRRSLVHRQVDPPPESGVALSVTPAEAGWQYVSFRVWKLVAGQSVRAETGNEEAGLVVLSGTLSVESTAGRWSDLGERPSVFEGKPYVVYLPPGVGYQVTATTDCEVAVGGSRADRGVAPYVIEPSQIGEELRGEGSARRQVRHLLEADRPAEHLFLVEVLTPGGNWSSYPPHKHDVDNRPVETYLEETYYHRVRPAQGFGVQRVYTEDRELDAAIAVEDGTLVLVPQGYHTVSAGPGYDLYYLNVMAGPVREWRFKNDPVHEWVAQGWRQYGAT